MFEIALQRSCKVVFAVEVPGEGRPKPTSKMGPASAAPAEAGPTRARAIMKPEGVPREVVSE